MFPVTKLNTQIVSSYILVFHIFDLITNVPCLAAQHLNSLIYIQTEINLKL